VKIDRKNQDILELIAISIDYPCRLMNRFECSSRSAYRCIDKLIDEGYVKKYKKDGICSLRLTRKGQAYLLDNNPSRFGNDSEKKRYGKSDMVKRLRLHRIVSTYTSMKNSGIKIFLDEKPKMFLPGEDGDVIIDKPAFYSAIEIKELGLECTKIKFSRAVGVLLCVNNMGFIVYNTDNSLMKWSSMAEQRLYGVLMGILLNRGIQIDDFPALMIGNDMETAKTQLLSTGGVKNSFFKLDNTFNEFYYVPLNKDGDFLLKILSDYTLRKKIKKLVMQSFRINANILPFASNGVDSEDRAVLLAYEFDMEKIRKFKSGLEMFEEKGIVICFEFQRKVLEEYFGNLARIITVNKEMVEKELEC